MGHSGCGEGKGQKVARCITNFYRQRLKHEVVQSLVLELAEWDQPTRDNTVDGFDLLPWRKDSNLDEG